MLSGVQTIFFISYKVGYWIGRVRGSMRLALGKKIRLFLHVISMLFKVKNCSTLMQFSGPISTSPFCTRRFHLGYYRSLQKLAALSVGEAVCVSVCVSVMRESVRTMKFYVFLCLFHVVVIELEF